MIVFCSARLSGESRPGCSGLPAVVEPRVDEVAHVHHVDPEVAGLRERIDARLQEEEPRVLPGPQVHERHVGRDAGHSEAVDRRARPCSPTCVRGSSRRRHSGLQESGSSSHGPSIEGMSVVKFRLSDRLKFGAMSGWLPSIPVSRMPDEHGACSPSPCGRSRLWWRGSSSCPTGGRPAARRGSRRAGTGSHPHFRGTAFSPFAAFRSERSCSSETFGRLRESHDRSRGSARRPESSSRLRPER